MRSSMTMRQPESTYADIAIDLLPTEGASATPVGAKSRQV